LGPYATREEAEQALEKVEKRNIEWDEDPAWEDED
jgi:L-alanine-DL-glutamate epimerase-like enolase superfamily enzyme